MGVMATKDLAEARLAFRSRMLDHFWGGIPTITTDGDVLAELIDAKNAGIVVPVGDRAALTNAMLRLAGDPKFRTECAKNAAELADTYRWTETVAPLRRIARNPSQWRTTRSMRLSRRQYDLTEDSQALLLQRRGQIDDYASLARLFHFVGNSKVLLPIARFVKRRILRR